jgi:carboxyl-terminal processing protease
VTLLVSGTVFHGKETKREKLLSQLIHTGLERWHYSGKKIDDQFSVQAFSEFLEYLDYGKRFLLQEDVHELRKYIDKVDDQFASGSTELMKVATRKLEQRIRQVIEFYPQLLERPFDFTRYETLEFDVDKLTPAANLEQLKAHWRKVLKYRTLMRYIDLYRAKYNSKDKSGKNESKPGKPGITDKIDNELEEKARKAVLKSFKSYFNRLLQGTRNDSLSRYINSLVQVYDPHTNYFPPVDKETFDMQMSGSFEGIGALLSQEEEYVKVASIVPGGPSWRQKQLKAGDLILKVAQGNKEPVDIIGMRVTDAVKLIRGKKGTLVRLSVKKPDGQITEIPIVRDVVILEETFAKSAVLVHKKSGKRFGYIHLPGFYNDFQQAGGRNSTDDVKKELETLKKKKVDGVILDLRNNRGGALEDAVRMSGLFLPEGPIVQVKDKRSRIMAREDSDPSIAYSGPLIVLVNSLSASASEILSAALQDYNRAIIVGGSHTYGKGTVQAMVPLDRFVSKSPDYKKSLGALTITIQKFYRVNGNSIQKQGVIPDIVLPDRYDSLEIGERHLDHSLDSDSILPASFEKWQDQSPATPELVQRSKNRVRQNPGFEQIREYVNKVKGLRHDTVRSLRLAKVVERQEKLKAESKKLEEKEVELTHFDILPARKVENKKSEQLNEIARDRQTEWFKEIKKDMMLGEVLEILADVTGIQ